LANRETVDLSVLHRLRAVSAVGIRFPLKSTANGKAALAVLADPGATLGDVAFDR